VPPLDCEPPTAILGGYEAEGAISHEYQWLWLCYGRGLSGLALLWRRLMFRTRFVAVTGSVGKTTATGCLAGILASRFSVNATQEGDNGRHGVAITVLRTRLRHRFAVVEVGTRRPGALRKAAWEVDPDVVVVLGVGRTHTDGFPTLDHTAAEKAALLSRMGRRGLAILNGDDRRVAAMAGRCRGRVVTFGLSPQCDLWVSDVTCRWPSRLSFRAHWRGDAAAVSTKLVGEHWVPSVAGALAAAISCGMDLESAAVAMGRVEPQRARLEPVVLPSGAVMLRDEFNPTAVSLPSALRVLEHALARRRFLVFNDVSDTGQETEERYRDLGRAFVRSTDVVVFHGANARCAAEAAVAAGMRPDCVLAFPTWWEVSGYLGSVLGVGDLVLLRCWETDHPERIFFTQFGTVACKRTTCQRIHLCDLCEELHYQPTEALPRHPASPAAR